VAYIREPRVRENGFWASLSTNARLGWLVIIGSLPIGLIGLKLKKLIEGPNTKNLWLIATMMIIIAVLLAIAEKVSSKRRKMQDLGVRDAVVVGFSQVLALIPGSSRSGSTIMGGLLAGETRETAARFSFLLSIPAVAASGLLELREAIHKLPQGSYGSLAIATIVAGVVGYVSIWFLLRFLRTHSTFVFIGYRLILGSVLLALLTMGAITPQDNFAAAQGRQDRSARGETGSRLAPGTADNSNGVSVN
jgi:undecaprenyl-diphosphatase